MPVSRSSAMPGSLAPRGVQRIVSCGAKRSATGRIKERDRPRIECETHVVSAPGRGGGTDLGTQGRSLGGGQSHHGARTQVFGAQYFGPQGRIVGKAHVLGSYTRQQRAHRNVLAKLRYAQARGADPD